MQKKNSLGMPEAPNRWTSISKSWGDSFRKITNCERFVGLKYSRFRSGKTGLSCFLSNDKFIKVLDIKGIIFALKQKSVIIQINNV